MKRIGRQGQRPSALLKLIFTSAAVWIAALICMSPGSGAMAAQDPATQDSELCKKQLEKVFLAIQAYRKDHKDLPDFISELVPKYIQDNNALICPVTKRTGQMHTFTHLRDPKLPKSYLYEFSALPMQGIWAAGEIKMKDFKRRQMGYVGGEVPMVRCHLHNPVLNLAFAGHIYGSGMNWEDNFTNVVAYSTWQAATLFPETRPRPMTAQPPVIRPPEPEVDPLTGKPAPPIKLALLDGGTFELASHKGKDIVLLDFWATWCGPCRVAMPVLVEVADQYAAKGVRYFAVNLREKPEVIKKYLRDQKLKIAVPLDQDGNVARQYNVRGIPTMVIVDKEGVVRKIHVGSSPELKADLTRTLDELLTVKTVMSKP